MLLRASKAGQLPPLVRSQLFWREFAASINWRRYFGALRDPTVLALILGNSQVTVMGPVSPFLQHSGIHIQGLTPGMAVYRMRDACK